MEQYVTYKKFIDKLQEFADRHPQVNSFGFGNLVEFGKDVDNTAPLYPLVFVVPQTLSYSENFTNYTVQVIIADRLNEDNEGSVSAISNMQMVGRDLLGQFYLNPQWRDFGSINYPIAGQPFLERFNDVLAGITMDISMDVSDYLDICQTEDFFTYKLYINGTDLFDFNGQNVQIQVRDYGYSAHGSYEIIYEHPLTGATTIDEEITITPEKYYQVIINNPRGAVTYNYSVGDEFIESGDCTTFKVIPIYPASYTDYTLDITMDPLCPQPTQTPTPTVSLTSTPTLTPTPTHTTTPTVTNTPTVSLTPTQTVTPTPEVTPTQTVTPTTTITPSPTQTPQVTPTQTLTPTITQTAAVTQTPSVTPTQTPTPSAVNYNILTEGSDDILTEGGDNLRTEQN